MVAFTADKAERKVKILALSEYTDKEVDTYRNFYFCCDSYNYIWNNCRNKEINHLLALGGLLHLYVTN